MSEFDVLFREEDEFADAATRAERRAFRQEFQWQLSPFTFAALLTWYGVAAAARGVGRLIHGMLVRLRRAHVPRRAHAPSPVVMRATSARSSDSNVVS
jgi:hypothetical protein